MRINEHARLWKSKMNFRMNIGLTGILLTVHKGIHNSVKNALTEFQHKNILEWNVTNQNGVFGFLVNDMKIYSK